MADQTRSIDDIIDSIAAERSKRTADLQEAVEGEHAFADLMGLFKDTIQQDIDFLHELALQIKALRD